MVISRNAAFRPAGVEVAGSPAEAMEKLKEEEKVFVIGGGTIYREFWDKADTLYLTRVGVSPEGDTFYSGDSPFPVGFAGPGRF